MNAPADNLLEHDRAGLEAWFVARGEQRFRGLQVLKWIHQQGVGDFEGMSNLSRRLRDDLLASACVREPEVVTECLQQAHEVVGDVRAGPR